MNEGGDQIEPADTDPYAPRVRNQAHVSLYSARASSDLSQALFRKARPVPFGSSQGRLSRSG